MTLTYKSHQFLKQQPLPTPWTDGHLDESMAAKAVPPRLSASHCVCVAHIGPQMNRRNGHGSHGNIAKSQHSTAATGRGRRQVSKNTSP